MRTLSPWLTTRSTRHQDPPWMLSQLDHPCRAFGGLSSTNIFRTGQHADRRSCPTTLHFQVPEDYLVKGQRGKHYFGVRCRWLGSSWSMARLFDSEDLSRLSPRL